MFVSKYIMRSLYLKSSTSLWCRASRLTPLRRRCSSVKKSEGKPEAGKREVTDALSDVVSNVESTARDHLANERTFLAWARTGLALVGLGVGIDALQRNARVQSPQSHPVRSWKAHVPGTSLVLTGGGVLGYSVSRYYRVQRCLVQGSFPINKVGIRAVSVAISMLTLASLMMTIADELVDTSEFYGVKTEATGKPVSKNA